MTHDEWDRIRWKAKEQIAKHLNLPPFDFKSEWGPPAIYDLMCKLAGCENYMRLQLALEDKNDKAIAVINDIANSPHSYSLFMAYRAKLGI